MKTLNYIKKEINKEHTEYFHIEYFYYGEYSLLNVRFCELKTKKILASVFVYIKDAIKGEITGVKKDRIDFIFKNAIKGHIFLEDNIYCKTGEVKKELLDTLEKVNFDFAKNKNRYNVNPLDYYFTSFSICFKNKIRFFWSKTSELVDIK